MIELKNLKGGEIIAKRKTIKRGRPTKRAPARKPTKRKTTKRKVVGKAKTTRKMPMKRQATTAYGRALDRDRRALPPGRRRSKYGTEYTERRSNRSDDRARHY